MSQPAHPCLACGACCAAYRVAFDRADLRNYEVPEDLIFAIESRQLAMKTKSPQNLRCQALRGQLGYQVSCGIYENRPSPCRRFRASFEDGTPHLRCDEARATIGLAPLTPQSFSGAEIVASPG